MAKVITPVNNRVTVTMPEAEYDAMMDLLKAAEEYIDLRDSQGLGHSSLEGKALNAAVKAWEAYQ